MLMMVGTNKKNALKTILPLDGYANNQLCEKLSVLPVMR